MSVLRSHPLDMSKMLKIRCTSVPEVRTVFGTGEIQMDKDSGQPVYTVGVKIRVEGETKADIIDVQVTGEPVGIDEDDPLIIEGLAARYWEREGRGGVTYRADSIRKAEEPTAPASKVTDITAQTGASAPPRVKSGGTP